MSGVPFDKKKENAGIPFEKGGKLPDFLTDIPPMENTDEEDDAATPGEVPPMMPDFLVTDDIFEDFEEVADEMPDLSTFGEVDVEPDFSAPDISSSPPDFSPDISAEGKSSAPFSIYGDEQPEPLEVVLESPPDIVPSFPNFEAEPPVPVAPPAELMSESPFSAPPLPAFDAIPEPVSPPQQPAVSSPSPAESPTPQSFVSPPKQPVVSPPPPTAPPAPQTFPAMSVSPGQQSVNQTPPPVAPSSSVNKKNILSRFQWLLRSFVTTGRLKTRITSFPKDTAPSQSTPSAPQSSLPLSPPTPSPPQQAISPQIFPPQSTQPLPETAPIQPEESMKQISDHIQEIDTIIESLSSVVSSMDTRLGEVSDTTLPEMQLPYIEKMITDILFEKLSSMDAFTSNVAGEVSALKESVGALKNTMESNASMLVEVLNAQSNITDIQIAISAKVDDLGTRTEVNMADIADTSVQVKAASEALESLTATVSVLLDEVSTTLSTTSGMEEIIGQLQADTISVNELSGFIESVHQQIQELETGISDLQGGSNSVEDMGSIDTMVQTPLVKLTHIKNEQPFVKLCMEWLEFLLELVGKNNMPEILDYYVGVGWISDDARLELMLMARGMDNYTEKDEWKLHPDDHLKSLWFIEQLCGIKVDRFTMQQIDRDISKMKDGLKTLYNL